MYLIRKKSTGKAHYWNGQDTACRMASTGGLSMRRYVVVGDPGDLEICHMCRVKSPAAKRKGAVSRILAMTSRPTDTAQDPEIVRINSELDERFKAMF